MASQALLSVSSLFSGYKGNIVVRDVSLSIEAGEVFGLIGLNGAGKTTTIKTIVGLREKISGQIALNNSNDMAYLPERFDPPWFLSGYEFLEFSLKLYGQKLSREDMNQMALSCYLDPAFLSKKVNAYSKGMRQKLGLLATFLTQASLLILDEPMSGLDPKARVEVKAMIKNAKASGRSVFMSSHVLSDIAELCDRVAIFHQNTIIFTGTPKEMLSIAGFSDMEKAFLTMIDRFDMTKAVS